MKFAVHWAPLVKSCTPGWIGAELAGAQAGAATAVRDGPAHPREVATRTAMSRMGRSRVPMAHALPLTMCWIRLAARALYRSPPRLTEFSSRTTLAGHGDLHPP